MKNLILTLGILLGSLVSPAVLSQNDTSVSEQVALTINQELGSNLTPEYISENSTKTIYLPLEKGTINEKIVNLILSLNKDKSEKNINYVKNTFKEMGSGELSFFTDVKNYKTDIVFGGQRKSSDTQDPKTGEYWRKNYYHLKFYIEGDFYTSDGYVDKKDILWITVNKGKFKNLTYYDY
tara:strand:+ start:756 stop:1295 length:540 start_codon:yes stop_codon:yes gene_type:complete